MDDDLPFHTSPNGPFLTPPAGVGDASEEQPIALRDHLELWQSFVGANFRGSRLTESVDALALATAATIAPVIQVPYRSRIMRCVEAAGIPVNQ
ncbi:hypothetical protein KUL25_03720 [Rhodobacteraceae bacterium N5(2021)]|uniref:Uncharacterized protein n=1 Tax=Gymnodinialimonas phycosphaerae TaxID=2841589 RepID=A0A975YGQ2_9RHOB|nr:hypothetical protein [Gymnodinialimonas phycosphaerae]MBY4891868.1 hypothetical protein [Gymnodinialimonas phycosphaerae]